jgi:hypothetical protein
MPDSIIRRTRRCILDIVLELFWRKVSRRRRISRKDANLIGSHAKTQRRKGFGLEEKNLTLKKRRRDFCELWLRTGSSAPSEPPAFSIGTQGSAKPPPWAKFSCPFGPTSVLSRLQRSPSLGWFLGLAAPGYNLACASRLSIAL